MCMLSAYCYSESRWKEKNTTSCVYSTANIYFVFPYEFFSSSFSLCWCILIVETIQKEEMKKTTDF